jgi:twitching motility protein PilI
VARISLREYQRELGERLRDTEGASVTSKLGVRVGNGNWLVDLGDAGEVIPVPPITPVPLTKPWFCGVTNIRGNLFSVVDFGAFQGGPPSAITAHSRLVILGERFRTQAALLVDSSLGLRSKAWLAPRESSAAPRPWIKGEFTDAEAKAWIELDVAQLAQQPDFLAVAI